MKRFGYYFIVIGILITLLSNFIGKNQWEIHSFLCIFCLIFLTINTITTAIKNKSDITYNTFITYSIAFSIFFLFGPIMQFFGSPEDIQSSREYYPFAADIALKVVGYNIIGFSVSIIASNYFKMRGLTIFLVNLFEIRKIRNLNLAFIIIIFFCGLLFKLYFFKISLESQEVNLGIISLLVLVLPLATFLYLRNRTKRPIYINLLVYSGVLIYSFIGLLEFSKTSIILPWIALFSAIFLNGPTLKKLLMIIAFFGIVLYVVQPILQIARNEANGLSADEYKNLETRFKIIINPGEDLSYDKSGIWYRLDYTAADVAGIEFYDNDNGGDSYKLIPWLFVPRIIYSDKPIMTKHNLDLNAKIVGVESDTSAGLGVFISGYYDLGFMGLILISSIIGWILNFYNAILSSAKISGSTSMLCIGLVGHFVAISIFGDYLNAYFGIFIITLYVLLLIILYKKILNFIKI